MDRIEITGADLVEVAKAVYDLSSPQGLGFLHARDGGLSDEDAIKLVEREKSIHYRNPVVLCMDYVHGRACKFAVERDADDRLWINAQWFDHSPEQMAELVRRIEATKACHSENP